MSEQQTQPSEKTEKPTAAPAKAPPAAPAKAGETKAEPAKPTPEQRDRAEHTAALLRAQKDREALASERAARAELEKKLAEASGGSERERARLAALAKSDFRAFLAEVGGDLGGVTKQLMGAAKQDPRDRELAELRKEIAGLKGFVDETKKEREERQKREAEAAEKHEAATVYDRMHGGMAYVVEQWEKTAPATDEDRAKAAGDELLLHELRRNPEGWKAELVAYSRKHASATGEQVRAHYGALLLRQAQERAKLRFVGALTGGSTTDAPTSQTGGNASADVPRTRARKPSGGAERDEPTTAKTQKHGLAQEDLDALRRAPRRTGR